MRRSVAILFCALFLAIPAQAGAAGLMGAELMTADVNVCDSTTHQLGVRATQGAAKPGERMFTQFSAEWLRPSTGRYEPIAASESPWIDGGPGAWLYRTTGYTRTFVVPPGGPAFTVRGVVAMEWRAAAGGVRRQVVVTGPCVLH